MRKRFVGLLIAAALTAATAAAARSDRAPSGPVHDALSQLTACVAPFGLNMRANTGIPPP